MPIFHSIWVRMIWQQKKKERKKMQRRRVRTAKTKLCIKCYNMEIIVVHYYYWCFCVMLWARARSRPLSTRIHRMLGVIHLNDNARSEQKRQISKKELWMEIGRFLSFFIFSLPLFRRRMAMIGAGGATKWIYIHISLFLLINASWIRNEIVCIISGRFFFFCCAPTYSNCCVNSMEWRVFSAIFRL